MHLRLLRDLYESGFSLGEVARMSDIPKGTVRHRLIAMGVQMRKRGGNRVVPPHQEYVLTAFMYERMGWSTNEIADQLGLRSSTVQNRLRQHGVRMRSKEESVRMRWARRPKKRAGQSE